MKYDFRPKSTLGVSAICGCATIYGNFRNLEGSVRFRSGILAPLIWKSNLSLAILILALPIGADAQNYVQPEVVRFENVRTDGEMKIVTVGNAKRHYSLICNVKAEGCVTPEPGQDYYLINGKTRFMMPGAKDALTLAFVQDWTSKYNTGENIGLVPTPGSKGGQLSMFVLDPVNGGLVQDIIFSDGPIIYGAGMNNDDRQAAWKHFFLQMVEAATKQQGAETLKVKLAKRCMPGNDFCTIALDANFIGIGGGREPRKVLLLVATDAQDQNKQVMRLVCTRPTGEDKICREWDTGKVVIEDYGQ